MTDPDPDPDFTEYAVRKSKHAQASWAQVPEEIQKIAETVLWELADDPRKYPDRTFAAEQGASRYVHPNPQFEITYKVDEQAKVVSVLHVSAQALPAASQRRQWSA